MAEGELAPELLLRLFVSALFHDPELLPRVADTINPKWFESAPVAALVEIARDVYRQVRDIPVAEVVEAELDQRLAAGTLTEDQVHEAGDIYAAVSRYATPTQMGALFPYLRYQGGALLQRFAMHDLTRQTSRVLARNNVPDEAEYLAQARAAFGLGRTRTADVPAARVRDESWFSRTRTRRSERIGTGIAELDSRIGGGIAAGEIGVIIGTAGSGKSHALVSCGAAASREYDVLHYTLELHLPETLGRYAAWITGMPVDERDDRFGRFVREFREQMEVYRGELVVREFATKGLTVADLRADIEEVRRLEHVDPKLVVIDYATIMAPSVETRRESQWVQQGVIFEDLRNLAGELKVAIWTAAQFNRSAFADTDPTLGQMGSSYEPAKVADLIVAITQSKTDKLDPDGPAMRFLPLKARNVAMGAGVKMRMDGATSRFVSAGGAPPPLRSGSLWRSSRTGSDD